MGEEMFLYLGGPALTAQFAVAVVASLGLIYGVPMAARKALPALALATSCAQDGHAFMAMPLRIVEVPLTHIKDLLLADDTACSTFSGCSAEDVFAKAWNSVPHRSIERVFRFLLTADHAVAQSNACCACDAFAGGVALWEIPC